MCQGVTRCPHESAADTIKRARLQLCARLEQGTRVCFIHFDKLTVAVIINDLHCSMSLSWKNANDPNI